MQIQTCQGSQGQTSYKRVTRTLPGGGGLGTLSSSAVSVTFGLPSLLFVRHGLSSPSEVVRRRSNKKKQSSQLLQVFTRETVTQPHLLMHFPYFSHLRMRFVHFCTPQPIAHASSVPFSPAPAPYINNGKPQNTNFYRNSNIVFVQ